MWQDEAVLAFIKRDFNIDFKHWVLKTKRCGLLRGESCFLVFTILVALDAFILKGTKEEALGYHPIG